MEVVPTFEMRIWHHEYVFGLSFYFFIFFLLIVGAGGGVHKFFLKMDVAEFLFASLETNFIYMICSHH